jgi:hypothetical protein
MATPKTVVLKGRGIRKEFTADAAGILPGMLIKRIATSGKCAVHATAAGNAVKMFAVENEVVGGDIDDAYLDEDNVLAEVMQPGSEVYAFLPANAAAVVIGDYLESDGTGRLRKAVTDAATDDTQRVSVVATALEAIDNSANGSPVRIRVEIL